MPNIWLYAEDELQQTPTIAEGQTRDSEAVTRAKGVNFIVAVGLQLKVPQMTIYAACVLFHRFYMRRSITKYHRYDYGGASLFLATKVEESYRKLREVVVACTRVASKNPAMQVDEQSTDFRRWTDTIIYGEEYLLETLCFDLTLDSPYEVLAALVAAHDAKADTALCRSVWAFVNDSCRTVLPVLYPAQAIACAAFYWAWTKQQKSESELKLPLPLDEVKAVVTKMIELNRILQNRIPNLESQRYE